MPECLRLFVYICWQYIWFSTSPSAWVHVSIWNVEKLCVCFSVCVYAILWHANTPNGHKLQKCWHCFSPTNSLCALSHLCVRIAKRLCDRTTQTSNRPTANAIYTCKTQPSTEEQKNNNSNRARLRVAREEVGKLARVCVTECAERKVIVWQRVKYVGQETWPTWLNAGAWYAWTCVRKEERLRIGENMVRKNRKVQNEINLKLRQMEFVARKYERRANIDKLI